MQEPGQAKMRKFPNHEAPAPRWRILLSGANDIIGRELISLAAKGGHALVLARAPGEKITWLEAAACPAVTLDDGRLEGAGVSWSDFDAVIDLATLRGENGKIRAGKLGPWIWRRLQGLVGAAAAGGVKKIVLLGNAHLFAGLDPEQWVTEANPLRGRGFGRVLAPLWDGIRTLSRESGVVTRVHPGRVYGSGGWFLKQVVEPLKYRGYLEMPGDGSNWISPVHSQDVAEGLLLAVGKGVCDRDYFLAGEPLRFEDFLNMSANYMGIQQNPRRQPWWRAAWSRSSPAVEDATISCRIRPERARSELEWTPRFPTPRDGVPQALKDLGVLAWK